MTRIMDYLRLVRTPNLLTSASDVIAGCAIALATTSIVNKEKIVFLVITSMLLYASGIVFNDIFDAEKDRLECPNRPIPSGSVSMKNAIILGSGLGVMALLFASQISLISLLISAGIITLCFTYNTYSKNHVWLRPINMGSCRALNLMLGMSLIGSSLWQYWYIAILPMLFIVNVTIASKNENEGANTKALDIAFALFVSVIMIMLFLAYRQANKNPLLFVSLLVFSIYNVLPYLKARHSPTPEKIKTLITQGILSIILLDVFICLLFGSLELAFVVFLLLPTTQTLGNYFKLT